MQAVTRSAASGAMRPLAALLQPQQAARRSFTALRDFRSSLAVAAPHAQLLRWKHSNPRMLTAKAAESYGAETQNQTAFIGMEDFNPEYENFSTLIGTLLSANQDAGSGCYTLTLAVRRDKQPIFDRFMVEVPAQFAQDCQAQLRTNMQIEVCGKLAAAAGSSIKFIATNINILAQNVPELTPPAEETAYHSQQQQQSPQRQQYTQPPAPQQQQQQQSGMAAAATGSSTIPTEARDEQEGYWLHLFRDPKAFFDNRATKQGRQPDFKEKGNGNVALWIESRNTPAWVFDNLQMLPGNKPYEGSYRPGGGSGGGSGSGGRPASAPNVPLDFLPADPTTDKERAWKDVFQNYRNWWDNRKNKLNPKAPDFKHKTDGTALWISSRDTPFWAAQHMDSALPPPPPPRQ